MIGAILRLFNGGLETYRQHKEIKANELKRQDELKAVQHAAQVERIKVGDEAATQLDEVSIAQRGWKDEYLMILTTLPLGLSFVPEWAHIVDAGFAALENVPEYFGMHWA
ncbi:hypothetical protein [Vibrio nigripulchritudo]|uniref:hypothetical protein n=1 Tax=Vibrio nigripulchritudo TaxID=28173 RepID=UPI002493793F|nr:hypothetical protein [Vibrio nigripulchritudo]BDU46908.1 hypothetical protein TUMSATVNIG3_57060 [Vibrio nigripulchritudo]